MYRNGLLCFPDGQEGWNEIRRTGYPCVFPVAQSTNGYDLDVPNRIPFDPREMNGNNQENYRKAVEMLGGKMIMLQGCGGKMAVTSKKSKCKKL